MEKVASEPAGNMEHLRPARTLSSGISMRMRSSTSQLPTSAAVCISSWETGMEPFQRGKSYGILGAFTPVVGDFNGDGKLDLVLGSYSGMLLLLGNGDGTFQGPQTIFPTTQDCGSGFPLVVNDFNGDGKLDLAFCSHDGKGEIGVLLGNGDGTFKKPVYYHAGNNYSTWAFAAGDFNSDGKTDFIDWHITNGVNGVFAILLGNGDGTFQKETTVSLPDNIEDLAIVPGDFNSDGLLDFVMLNAGIQVYLQK